MGIRYYAYPITADEYSMARENPHPYLGDDPLMDAWGPIEDKPEMLYLDKCWNELQALLGSGSSVVDRPALQLVTGHVTDTPMGWIPFERALSPGEVLAIAVDLATVGEANIRDMMTLSAHSTPAFDGEHEYIAQYLSDAQKFTARLAADGRGLVYRIG